MMSCAQVLFPIWETDVLPLCVWRFSLWRCGSGGGQEPSRLEPPASVTSGADAMVVSKAS
jgi:hypothetical protein